MCVFLDVLVCSIVVYFYELCADKIETSTFNLIIIQLKLF